MSANPLAPFPRGFYGLSPWICTDVRDSFVTNRTSKVIHITFEAMQCLPGSLGALAVGDPRCHVRNPTTLRPSCCWGHVEVLQLTAQLNSQPTTKLPDVWVSHFSCPAQLSLSMASVIERVQTRTAQLSPSPILQSNSFRENFAS